MPIVLSSGPISAGGKCRATVTNSDLGRDSKGYSLTLFGSGGTVWRILADTPGGLLPGGHSDNHEVDSGDCVYFDHTLRQ